MMGIPTPPVAPTMAGHFASGYDFGRGGPTLSPGLEATSARFNAQAPHGYRPMSILNQVGLSPLASNASAPDVANRFNSYTGTVMPNTGTGASDNTAEAALRLRFAGQDEA
jgi:hypothetical protein